MANETIITLVGNLTADPELRYTGSGHPVVNFTIASTPRTYNRQSQQWEDGDTLFIRCSAWREAAENIANSLTKGMRVIAHGALSQRSYEGRDGQQRTSLEMQVEDVGPSLRRATAQVTRNQQTGGYEQQVAQNGAQSSRQAARGQQATMSSGPTQGDDQWMQPTFDNYDQPPF